MKQYMVLHAFSEMEIENQVSDLEKRGWKPQGGIAVTSFRTSFFSMRFTISYFQAMIRLEVTNATQKSY